MQNISVLLKVSLKLYPSTMFFNWYFIYLHQFWSSDEDEEEESSGTNYKFSGYMSYLDAELSFEGSMNSPDENGEFEASLEVTNEENILYFYMMLQ